MSEKKKTADIWPEKRIDGFPVAIWIRGDGTGLVRVRHSRVLDGRMINLGGLTVTLRKRCQGVWSADISQNAVESLRKRWLLEEST